MFGCGESGLIIGVPNMILRSVRVQNFKCVEDSEPFKVESVTCLVGKNESGKTALLEALYKLNPVSKEEADFEDLLEYPRRYWSEYKERKKDHPDNVLTTEWELTAEDRAFLDEVLGPKGYKGDRVTIKRGYNNTSYYHTSLDEESTVRHYLASSGLYDEEKSKLAGVTSVEHLIKTLEGQATPSEREKAFLANLKKNFPKGTASGTAIGVLSNRLPKIVYFGQYYTLPGQVAMTQLAQKKASSQLSDNDRVFLALLDLAGTSADDIQGTGRFEALVAELEAISNRITQEIFKYWSQNKHLEVEFRFDHARSEDPAPFNQGFIFRTRIRNRRHGVTVSFDERSSGFVWFFSFLVWFSQVRKVYGDNLVILLDEPALNLHARAQADLLLYINERLKPSYQVFYTTHSPFMVDPENLLGTRTVEDVVKKQGSKEEALGTKVREDVLSVDPDTIFPLQAALGYDITQTLFVGKHTLLVEGPSDLLYLKWFSNELKGKGRVDLDPRWVISPVGGIDKVASFVALFGGSNLHVAVFADYHKGSKGKVRSLKESDLLKKGHVFTAEMFTGGDEADTEDLIGRANYVSLVNEAYSLTGSHALPGKRSTSAPTRVLEEVENHFAVLPETVPTFDHYAPASFLVENTAQVRLKFTDLDVSLERFEKLFKDLNALLPS
jgi:AAA15 family ATPase/GTPase